MPIFRPDGRPFLPTQLVGTKKLEDYAPLTPDEFKQVCRQLEEGLSAGIADEVPVTIPTGVFARVLQTARIAAGAPWKAPEPIPLETVQTEEPLAPPPESMPYLTEMPGLERLRARIQEEMKTAASAPTAQE